MGASAYASLHVGFEVTHEDFWTTETQVDDHLSCPQGHAAGDLPSGKHCPDCGGKIGRQCRVVTEPTEDFRKLCASQNIEAASVVPSSEDGWTEGSLLGLDIFCAEGATHEDDHALGLRLASTGDILCGEGGDAVPAEDVEEAVYKITEIRHAMGLTERPVCLFLLSRNSY